MLTESEKIEKFKMISALSMKLLMSGEKGKKALKEIAYAQMPKSLAKNFELFLDGKIPQSEFFKKVNDDALDAYNAGTETERERNIALMTSEELRKQIEK